MEIKYLEEYLKHKSADRGKNTLDSYKTDLMQFFSFYHEPLENINNEVIESYTNSLIEKGYKAETVNRKLVSIRQYVDYINISDHIPVKMFVEIKQIKIHRRRQLEELLEQSDFDRLVRMAQRERDARAIAIFYALFFTGARVSELLQLKASDYKKSDVLIRGKGEKYRDLLIPDELISYLDDYVKDRKMKKSGYLFVNIRNDNVMSRQEVHRTIKKYAGMAKVKLSRAHAHNFRHLCAFRLIDLGLSLDEVADVLGHTDINTTRIYTRRTKKDLLKTINKLNRR